MITYDEIKPIEQEFFLKTGWSVFDYDGDDSSRQHELIKWRDFCGRAILSDETLIELFINDGANVMTEHKILALCFKDILENRAKDEGPICHELMFNFKDTLNFVAIGGLGQVALRTFTNAVVSYILERHDIWADQKVNGVEQSYEAQETLSGRFNETGGDYAEVSHGR